MIEKRFSLSNDDFDSGRFTKVARIIVKSWPGSEPITLSKAQEVLAVTLGYADYHDARKSATHRCTADSEQRATGDVFRLDRFLHIGWHACASTLESWPLHMLGRWNMAGLPCMLGSEAINQAISIFTEYFASDTTVIDSFQVKHTPCALSLLANELSRSSYVELQRPLGSLISGVARQAGFDRGVEFLFQEFFTSRYSDLICDKSGLSLSDIWQMPRNKSSFPDLYAALNCLYDSWLQEPAINRFLKSRLSSGFYNDDPRPDIGRDVKPSIIDQPSHRVVLHLQRVWLDDCPFKAYTWKARSLNHEGKVLAEAEGGFVAGPKGGGSSAELIEATEDCGVASVYAYLKHLIADWDDGGEDVAGLTPSNLNTEAIFGWGNLLMINYLERHERAAPGAGIALLAAVIKDLKRRYKRSLNVIGLIDPYQYHLAARQISCLEERRAADAHKVINHLQSLRYADDAVDDLYFELETDTRLPCEIYYEAVTSSFE